MKQSRRLFRSTSSKTGRPKNLNKSGRTSRLMQQFPYGVLLFCRHRLRFEPLHATIQWTVAGDGSTEPNLSFSFLWKEKCSKSGRCSPIVRHCLSRSFSFWRNSAGQIWMTKWNSPVDCFGLPVQKLVDLKTLTNLAGTPLRSCAQFWCNNTSRF